MRNKFLFSLILFFLIFCLQSVSESQVRSIYDNGASGLGQLLKRLQTVASALHTGAHPDDEDSALLAYLARKKQARVAYLSLNRGEGGQNAIGAELFEPLGIIRTEELLQARKLDGAEQFFTRAMDFGFSKTLKESASIWNERIILEDMVRVIRLYRPLIVISRFSGTPADGHGHHQLAGYLTPIAFELAADPSQFPEQIVEGLRPWQAKKLYVSEISYQNQNDQTQLNQSNTVIELNTGEFDFLVGRSYYEIAMEGRSQHKSQEMGSLELLGKQVSKLRLVKSVVPTSESDIFDGIDTSIKGISEISGDKSEKLKYKLVEIQSFAEKALNNYDPFNPSQITPFLAQGYKKTQEALTLTENPDAQMLLKQKLVEFARALIMANGIIVDALSDTETPNPGDPFNISVRVFNPPLKDIKVESVELITPDGWSYKRIENAQTESPSVLSLSEREQPSHVTNFRVEVPTNAAPTQPYWLMKQRKGFTFDWDESPAKTLPFESPLIRAKLSISIGDTPITVEKPIEYRYADPIRGEIRRQINIVPKLSVAFDQDHIISPINAEGKYTHEVTVTLTNHASKPTSGVLKLSLPNGWTSSPETVNFTLKSRAEKASYTFTIRIPISEKSGSYRITAEAIVDGKIFNQALLNVSYPNIQTHRYYKPAEVIVKRFDLKIAKVKVGYIMGSGDKVPEAIRRMGLDVTMLNDKDLSTVDLSKFDVIVVGIRASQVRPDFVANNNRLLEYVNNGGTLIVQYQQQDYVRQNLIPFPARMDPVKIGNQTISNLRVTDENAPVKILVPDHPIFNLPNKIDQEDWKGWVQERNLYCFTQFDSRYIPLLESHDEGEPENKGGMLYAEIGKGKFIYTAYSWFRQLPAGNPGAYRIFANMLSLPKANR